VIPPILRIQRILCVAVIIIALGQFAG